MRKRKIFMTEFDKKRLTELMDVAQEFDFKDRNDLKMIQSELERAKVVDSKKIPENVVTMNSRLQFMDLEDNEKSEVTLVFPANANIAEGKLSILSPIGTALLGYAEGDEIEWEVPGGSRRILIEKILYQPEAAGDLHL
ncbi:nucleoside diphosphate kinase regulator [Kiritimatiellaeota bacterium B1221]|nr:nucleoside diphosphate kinase regulator [Kiritimatiellaeota bacterium B1221]